MLGTARDVRLEQVAKLTPQRDGEAHKRPQCYVRVARLYLLILPRYDAQRIRDVFLRETKLPPATLQGGTESPSGPAELLVMHRRERIGQRRSRPRHYSGVLSAYLTGLARQRMAPFRRNIQSSGSVRCPKQRLAKWFVLRGLNSQHGWS